MKRSVPKFQRNCKKQGQRNWKAVQKRQKAVAKGRIRVAERQDKIIGDSFTKGCDARKKALQVYQSYKNDGDDIAAEAVEGAIQSCLQDWSVCDQ